VRPGGVLCVLFLEGSVAFGILAALAELASWWAVVVIPVTVAAMVKINDVVAGAAAAAPRRSCPGREAGAVSMDRG
jgi:predicted secreted protein